MSRLEFRVPDGEGSRGERLTAALAKAIGAIIEQHGSPNPRMELLVTVRGDQVSVSMVSGPGPNTESFASWLRFQLEEQRLTKVALADRLGVSERTVRRWLAGDTEPRFQELLRISSLFGNPPV
jgi:DNA-binding XRE family transcriptional regulator